MLCATPPPYTLASATIEKMTRITSSAPNRATCVRAESSIPMKQMAVITTIQMTPTKVTQNPPGLLAIPWAPNSEKVYCPAIELKLGMTTRSVTRIPQPAIHPVFGPMARVTHVKVVPQSGSARFM